MKTETFQFDTLQIDMILTALRIAVDQMQRAMLLAKAGEYQRLHDTIVGARADAKKKADREAYLSHHEFVVGGLGGDGCGICGKSRTWKAHT